jgi:hypothetical protein
VTSFTTPAGANYIRFQIFQSDASSSAHDLDMFVYRISPSPGLIGVSGGPDANEIFNTTSAGSLTAGAQFKVYVHGCNVDPSGGSYTQFIWALTGTPSDAFTTKPSNHAVTIGQSDATTFGWSGLPAGNRYLGRVVYNDGAVNMAATQMGVSTR